MLAAALMLTALLQTAAPATAHQHAPAASCAATDASLPADLSAWSSADTSDASAIMIGQPLRVGLQGNPAFHRPPARAPQAGRTGVTLPLHIETAGSYSVAIDGPAWIDVVGQAGAFAATSAHGHGPECSSIRKQVTFNLIAGDYIVQISNATTPTMRLMVTPAP